CITTSTAQPAGLVSIQNGAVLTANLPATITCPAGHYAGTTANNGTCRSVSYPLLANDVFWQNRTFYIGVGSRGPRTLNQQNIVTLYDGFTSTAAPSQSATGACPSPVSYWDIGVRGDTGPSNHSSTVTLANYARAAGSPVINYIPSSATTNYNEAPATDFFGTSRKNGSVDAGAVEFAAGTTSAPPTLTSIAPTSGAQGTAVAVTLTG